MLRKGYGGLYRAPTKEKRRKCERLRGGRDQIKFIKATVAYTRPQQKRKSDRLAGQRDEVKFIDLRFERRQVVGLSELC